MRAVMHPTFCLSFKWRCAELRRMRRRRPNLEWPPQRHLMTVKLAGAGQHGGRGAVQLGIQPGGGLVGDEPGCVQPTLAYP